MVNRCVAAGCSNTPSDSVSLFRFPKDHIVRNQWEKQVQRTRAKWKATEHSFLCSEHFTDDSFEVDSAIASKFGMKIRKRLKPGAVPTVFHRPSTATQVREQEKVSLLQKRASSSIEGNGAPKKTKRRAVEKRERYKVWQLSSQI